MRIFKCLLRSYFKNILFDKKDWYKQKNEDNTEIFYKYNDSNFCEYFLKKLFKNSIEYPSSKYIKNSISKNPPSNCLQL